VPDFHQEAADGGLFLLQEEGAMAMKTRTHFTFRVDTWTPDGESIVEHVAGVEEWQEKAPPKRGLKLEVQHGALSDEGLPRA
jgi:hypothetical protein